MGLRALVEVGGSCADPSALEHEGDDVPLDIEAVLIDWSKRTNTAATSKGGGVERRICVECSKFLAADVAACRDFMRAVLVATRAKRAENALVGAPIEPPT